MSLPQLVNLPASVKQRLINLSRQTQVEFNVLLTKYALERFLYRLSISRYRRFFILKGALLFGVWGEELHRTTKDADVLNLRSPSPERLTADFKNICEAPAEPDGIRFLPESVQAREIRRENRFGGIRMTVTGMLGKAVIPLQVDVGFGDACVPPARTITYPALLDFPAPSLRACSRETMIAEKFHAAVVLGMRNSRMKDYFDIFYLSGKFEFKGHDLSRSLIATFARQGTQIPRRTPLGLSSSFANEALKNAQWKQFLFQTNAVRLEKDFAAVVASIRGFLMPVARTAATAMAFEKYWPPGGPWRAKEDTPDS